MNPDERIVCRCEEITYGEIRSAIAQGARDVDAVKRMTRAGMGLCQGKSCARLVSQILSAQLGIGIDQVPQATPRMPVRPVAASVFAARKRQPDGP